MAPIRPSDLGLPSDDLTGYELVFNTSEPALAVLVWVRKQNVALGRIYLRVPAEERYVPLASGAEMESDSCLIAGAGPHFFFLRQQVVAAAGGWSANRQPHGASGWRFRQPHGAT
jgi:hypothetical protein